MKLINKSLAVTFFSGFIVFSASADEQKFIFNDTHNTLIINAGRGVVQNACASPYLTGFTQVPPCSEKGISYGIAYEYRLTDIWGLGISYGRTGNATAYGNNRLLPVGMTTGAGAPAQWEMTTNAVALYGTGTLPLASGFSLKGKVGVADIRFNESYLTTINGVPYQGTITANQGSKYTLTYGIGAQYDINKDIGVIVQYDNYGKFNEYAQWYGITAPQISLSAVSLGLVMKW